MTQPLKVTKANLKFIINDLKWITQPTSNGAISSISGLNEIRNAISMLEDNNLFKEITEFIKNTAIYNTSSNSIAIKIDEVKVIVDKLNTLKVLSENLFTLLSNVLPAEDENSINIKLPPVNDFDELSVVSRNIHIALSQVIFNEEINGTTIIKSVENGSIWLNVLVGNVAARMIGSLAWASTVIYKKMQEGKAYEQYVRGLNIKNDHIEAMLDAQKIQLKLLIEEEAKLISNDNFKEQTNENIEKLKNSIELFADLIQKGAEIIPSIVAPEEVKNLYPKMTNLGTIESKTKMLDKGVS